MPKTFSPVPELNLLKEFHDSQGGYVPSRFEINAYDDYQDPVFDGRLVCFATANGSGSMYAIWRRDDRDDLATLPVVALGDEGGLVLVARDFREFLRLLASLPTDSEPHIDWESFGIRDGYEPVDNGPFLSWLARTFGLTPVEDWETIVDNAEAELAKEWAAWIHPRVPDAVWSPVHELNLLNKFRDRNLGGFANGFWLHEKYGNPTGRGRNRDRKVLDNPRLADDLALFATNDSDTYFALWRLDDRPDPGDSPVVALGKTGGAYVVARDVPEFFRLLAGLTDSEIWCDGSQVGLRACEPARYREEFATWLEDVFQLRPADPATVIATAQAELGGRLTTRPAPRGGVS